MDDKEKVITGEGIQQIWNDKEKPNKNLNLVIYEQIDASTTFRIVYL